MVSRSVGRCIHDPLARTAHALRSASCINVSTSTSVDCASNYQLSGQGGVESSVSYPMLKITELSESITHVLLVL